MRTIRAAHNYRENHDKVYVVGVVRDGSEFCVVARWGRRGVALPETNTKVYHRCGSISEAERMADSTIRKKIGSGYVDVESEEYSPKTESYTINAAKHQFGKAIVADDQGASSAAPMAQKSKVKPAPKIPKSIEDVYRCYAEDKKDVEFLVVCIDTSAKKGGIDIARWYDNNEEYVAAISPLGSSYIRVCDRFGEMRSVLSEQFKFVSMV